MRVLAAVVLACALASPARAAELYTVAGGGSHRLAEGVLAGTAQIAAGGIDVAADPRGGFAFTTNGTIWHVGRDGRLHRLTLDIYTERIAYTPDGALYAGTGDAVSRIAPDGTIAVVAGQPAVSGVLRRRRAGGRGAPALTAAADGRPRWGSAARRRRSPAPAGSGRHDRHRRPARGGPEGSVRS